MFVGANVWDPTLIIAQILSMQFLFYLSMGLLQMLALKPFVSRLSVSYILDWHTLHLSSKAGWVNVVTHLVTAVLTSAVMMGVVERAKKCLDFASTCYIWHLIFVWHYSGWPSSVTWWLTEGGSFAVLAFLGEWLCIQREMQDIPLMGLLNSSTTRTNRKDSSVLPTLAADDGELQPLRPRARGSRAAGGVLGSSMTGSGSGGGGAANGSSSSMVVQLASFVRNAASASTREGASGAGGPRKVTPRGDTAV